MNEEITTSEEEGEESVNPFFLRTDFGQVLRQLCCLILYDAIRNQEFWYETVERQQIVYLASCTVEKCCREVPN